MFNSLWNALGTGKSTQHKALEAEVEACAGEVRRLRTEWVDVLDKINAWAAREAARSRRSIAANLGAPPQLPAAATNADGEWEPPPSRAERLRGIR